MAGIMHLEELDKFIQENRPGVYDAIREHIMDAVKFSGKRRLMPESFRLPVNMPWREVFRLEEELEGLGFNPSHRYEGDERNPAVYLISDAFGNWNEEPPRDIRLYLTVQPRQHQHIVHLRTYSIRIVQP